MNERIKELLQQSTNPPWDGEQGPMNEFNLERFALLIVEECSNVAHECILKDGSDFPVKSVAYRIKEHFGVEL
jgi:hypothetical protein